MGLVIRAEDFGDTVFLCQPLFPGGEAMRNRPAAIQGFSLQPLGERILSFNGQAAIRQLNKALTPAMLERLFDFFKEYSQRPFDRDVLAELASLPIDQQYDTDGLAAIFSSSMVAEAFQRLGLLSAYPDGWATSEYTATDFSSARELKLSENYKLQQELFLA